METTKKQKPLLFDYEGFLKELKQGLVISPFETKLMRKEIRLERAILWLQIGRIPTTLFLFPKGAKIKVLIETRLTVLMEIERHLRKR